eukprot:scaffold80375_cov26-Tisochrysis_lutea.AAC.2
MGADRATSNPLRASIDRAALHLHRACITNRSHLGHRLLGALCGSIRLGVLIHPSLEDTVLHLVERLLHDHPGFFCLRDFQPELARLSTTAFDLGVDKIAQRAESTLHLANLTAQVVYGLSQVGQGTTQLDVVVRQRRHLLFHSTEFDVEWSARPARGGVRRRVV